MIQVMTGKVGERKKPNSMIQNSITAFRVMGKRFPHSRWQVPLYMACCIAAPFMTTLIPSLAIKAITVGKVGYFLAAIILVLCAYWGMDAIRSLVSLYLDKARFFTRFDTFMGEFINKTLKTDYANVESQKMQRRIGKAAMAVEYPGTGVQRVLSETVEFMIKIFGLLIYGSAVLVLDVRILLVTVLLLAMDVLMRSHSIRYSDAHWEENLEVYYRQEYLNRSGLEVTAGKDIRIYQMKEWFHVRFEELIRLGADFERRTQLRWYYPTLVDNICSFVKNLLSYGILASKVLSGELDVAGFTLYLGVISGLETWIYPLALSFSGLRGASHRFNDYQEYMDTPDSFLHGSGTTLDQKGQGSGEALEIEFRDVSFAYESGGSNVLSHLSFTIKPGEKVALVGNNGTGKTTMVKLMCGLYPVTEGKILINGKNLSEMDIDAYHGLLSVLFQDTTPMAFSIAMNVSGCSEENMNRERVRESLRRAGLWEKVSSLPQKEDTYLTQQLDDDGILLSGGELQKMLLARALYKGGQLLILDEPTAALDPIAESQVYEDYHKLTEGKTSLFISHRLASTRFCDRIFFLENGRVAEVGTHEELMRLGGRYKELFEIQSHYYQEVKADEE